MSRTAWLGQHLLATLGGSVLLLLLTGLAPLEAAPLVAMAVVALLLTAAGAAAFRRRDLVA
ncbi:hypothetical protein [Cellulomonas cellasea]|uniref:Putative exporter of polyketide antibiotics n=1 Tax=Cellulomonas cellasea TaxID=43670 RepID=A0A7W4YAG0_9CELL|nr:hypothetical protein [Cellulomonas cellasea]MBB2921742.1 putative exporter of polyketide antibiotics [Cellulomonas cellasea]